MDVFWKPQSSTQDGCDPSISDSYLLVIGIADPLVCKIRQGILWEWALVHSSLVPRRMKEWKQETEQNIFTLE